MTNNDVLRSVRYILDLRDAKLVEIFRLANCDVSLEEIQAYLRKEEEPGYQDCPDEVIAFFLDSLILFRRGRDEKRPLPPIEIPITNNIILKKLRVAFELKEEDILQILKSVDMEVGRHEISAFFRREGHPNYRDSGDQFLRNFLKGLALKIRK